MKKTTLTYDAAMSELQAILDALQQQTISIDDMIVKSKRAAELITFCKEKLRSIENETKELF
ncbi:MAG: exodeoxyribonuclease VII small subunit [Saprospiraceae bacterium]|nr:exodeoxyribonuclease VII small subunit [Saprospiraceae bacterium]MBP7699640.1 exodeoxyribonuclease VII small subunit [Saprospiraceae bacterium]